MFLKILIHIFDYNIFKYLLIYMTVGKAQSEMVSLSSLSSLLSLLSLLFLSPLFSSFSLSLCFPLFLLSLQGLYVVLAVLEAPLSEALKLGWMEWGWWHYIRDTCQGNHQREAPYESV